MKLWVTEIIAIDPLSGELKKYGGPEVRGINAQAAWDYCQQNGLGYCRVQGELVAEIPCKTGTFEPDFKNMVDYENTQNN